MQKVLIIEDNLEIAHLLQQGLQDRGLQALIARHFTNVLQDVNQTKPNVILMDIYLPVHDGYYWTQQIREFSKVPIIFVSSAEERLNTVAAIQAGADDFIAKPFNLEILNAKIHALLRRTYDFDKALEELKFAGYTLDIGNLKLIFGEQQVDLTHNETIMLRVLFENQEHLVSKKQLMNTLWQNSEFIDENTLRVNMSRLKKKLQPIKLDSFIHMKRGQGYFLRQN